MCKCLGAALSLAALVPKRSLDHFGDLLTFPESDDSDLPTVEWASFLYDNRQTFSIDSPRSAITLVVRISNYYTFFWRNSALIVRVLKWDSPMFPEVSRLPTLDGLEA